MSREIILKPKSMTETSTYRFAVEENINFCRTNIVFENGGFHCAQIISSLPVTHPDYTNKLKDLIFFADDIQMLKKIIAKIEELQNERRILQ